MSDHTSFEIDGDILVIFHEDRFDRGEVMIAEDGGLTVNGAWVTTDGRARRLLRRFFREAARLEEAPAGSGPGSEGLDPEAAAYATAALRSLATGGSDDDDPGDGQGFDPDLEEAGAFDEQEEGPQEKLMELAEELRDLVPELAELDWFLDG